MKHAIPAAILGAVLVGPTAAAQSGGTIQEEKLLVCDGLDLDLALQHATSKERRHIYHLSGRCTTRQWRQDCAVEGDRCLVFATSPQTFQIAAQYDVERKRAYEKIQASGDWGTMEMSYQCPSDPWRSDATCRLVDVGPLHPIERLVFGRGEHAALGQSSSEWYPYSRSVRPQVIAYWKQQIAAGMPPRIESPEPGGSVDWQEPFSFRACNRPLEDWFADLHGPIAEGRGEFTLQRWLPGKGWATTVDAKSFQGMCNPYQVANDPLAEGKWRIAVRHAEDGWPWSDFVEFWVGDPVRENATPPEVLHPKHGEVVPSAPVTARAHKDGVYKREFEAEWQPWNSTLDTWDPSSPFRIRAPLNQPFDLPDGGQAKARWRVRVSSPSDPQYPWSSWQTFYVGANGQALKDRDGKKIVSTEIGAPRASIQGATAESGLAGAMPESRASDLEAMRAAAAPRIVSPRPGAPVAGDLVLRFSGPDQAVVVEAEQFRAGRWEALRSVQLGTPRRSMQGVHVPRSALAQASRVRVRVRREADPGFGPWQAYEVLSDRARDALTQQSPSGLAPTAAPSGSLPARIPVGTPPAPPGGGLPARVPAGAPSAPAESDEALRKQAPADLPGLR